MKFRVLILIILFATISYANEPERFLVRSGDTLYGLLEQNFSGDEIMAMSRELKGKLPGFVLRAGMSAERGEDLLSVEVGVDRVVQFYRDNDFAKVDVLKFEQHKMATLVSGTISTSLFDAVKEIGETPELAASLARMYEWEFDFFRDIHPGDSFTVFVEKCFVKDKYIGYGRVLAADFVVQGKHYKAYSYQDGKRYGYYNEKGQALERGFLRVPLNYARISSRFTNNRKHPVFGVNRPHYGVDYAAPTGTPVMATASGTISRMSYAKGNGRFIEVRHSNGYKTYYLHLSRFNRLVRVGSQVNQGQVIGYVGSTGYSTGPHLDYRINHRGRWLNPLNFIAESPKLNEKSRLNFMEVAAKYEQYLETTTKYAGVYKSSLMP